MATWRNMLTEAMEPYGDSIETIIASTLSDEDLDREFSDGYGGIEGIPFTVWTAARVYFPACYDGSEWVASVPRYPTNVATNHVGGG